MGTTRERAAAHPDRLPACSSPPQDTVERWAYDYVTSCSLEHKLAPAAPPAAWQAAPKPLLLSRPGRPEGLTLAKRSPKTPGPDALRDPKRRALLLHTFLHHELQAAELMCRALLAYPQTAAAFRRGLLGICLDEIRHMGMYATHIRRLGFEVGAFPVNDWFWSRVPADATPIQFTALMGMGFEGANLDHTVHFAQLFERAGDPEGAEMQRRVGQEEVGHVAFARDWFERWTGGLDFQVWRQSLPAPLSPMLMRRHPLNRDARRQAGMDETFLEQLDAWKPA